MRHTRALALAVVAGTVAAVGYSGSAFSADHGDSPAAASEPTADLNDVYAWMVDTNTVALALSVGGIGNVTATTKFNPAVQYVFHTASAAPSSLGPPVTSVPATNTTDVIATFDANDNISLWVGTSEFVTGNASGTTGLASADGKVKVFAGVRADPFFFNFTGFTNTVATVESAAGSLPFNDAGCPLVEAGTSAALATELKSGADGGAAVNNFATNNVLAIVVTIDKSLLTAGGSLLSVWGATYATTAAPTDGGADATVDAAEDSATDSATDAKADATDAGGQ